MTTEPVRGIAFVYMINTPSQDLAANFDLVCESSNLKCVWKKIHEYLPVSVSTLEKNWFNDLFELLPQSLSLVLIETLDTRQ